LQADSIKQFDVVLLDQKVVVRIGMESDEMEPDQCLI